MTNGNNTSLASPTSQPNSEHRLEKRLALFFSNSSRAARPGGCSCGSAHCACGSSCRCASHASFHGCACAGVGQHGRRRRRRRSADYGTLETIDVGSLNALRKEYKLGLKEITLSPDEDPAEALMRYNAASIREALERASQEPLEISGDQMAAGEPVSEQEYAAETTTAATPTTTSTTERVQQDMPSSDQRAEMTMELAATRVEFKKLYSLIESLTEQLTKAELRLKDCQVEATTTTSTTSSTTSTTERPGNAHWTQLLANKGYDTNYLSKAHEQQYAQGEHLDLSKSELNGSGDYSYQELPPYDPDNKSKRATGPTTESSAGVLNQAQLLNAALHGNDIVKSDPDAAAAAVVLATTSTTPTPYALRGKFVRRRSTRLGLRTTRQAKVTKISSRANELSLLRARSTKLDQLIDVLNELLRLQLQRENALAKIAGSTTSTTKASSMRRPSKSSKRLRRRRKQRPSSTSSPI